MIGDDHALTPGYVARHVPPGSKIGIHVAVLDIAQDFLLAHLAERGVLGDLAIFKGGTALRKLFAGARGRFSTDMDLASREPEADRHALAEIIADEADVALGPFRFRPSSTRGRWHHRRGEPVWGSRDLREARRGPANLARARAKAVRPTRYARPVRFHPADYRVSAVGGDPRREDCALDSERDGTGRVRSGLGSDDEPSLQILDRSGSETGHA